MDEKVFGPYEDVIVIQFTKEALNGLIETWNNSKILDIDGYEITLNYRITDLRLGNYRIAELIGSKHTPDPINSP